MKKPDTFKLQIYKYALITAALMAVIGLPLFGTGVQYVQYAYGLLFGASISIISFNILLLMSKKVLSSGKKQWAPIGYLLRLPLYGVAFYLCVRLSLTAGIACILGFMTTPLAMIYVHGIKAKFSNTKDARPKAPEGPAREDTEKEG